MTRYYRTPETARRKLLNLLPRKVLRQMASPQAPHALTALSKAKLIELALPNWHSKTVKEAIDKRIERAFADKS